MQIKKNATQEELEAIAKKEAHKIYRDILQLNLRAQIVIIFLCLFNPPAIFGFFMIGALLTAIFACCVAWAYMNNEVGILNTAINWWFIWAAVVYLLNFGIRALFCRRIAKQLPLYKPADEDTDDVEGTTNPQAMPLRWEKDEEGAHWQSLVLFHAPVRGLYALELVIENYDGTLESCPECACATAIEEIPGDRSRFVGLYRLEAGKHWLPVSLTNANGEQGPEATLTQLSGPQD